jgi:hypothetical protein
MNFFGKKMTNPIKHLWLRYKRKKYRGKSQSTNGQGRKEKCIEKVHRA